jgi:multidrug efflux system membrane fusion protein
MRSASSFSFLLLAATLLAPLAGCTSEATVAPPARPAIVQQPQPATSVVTDTYAGEVRARYESVLGFRIAGKVQVRNVDVGARVRKGDVIAELEPQDAELALSSAQAQVAWAKADLALAKAELDRHAAMLQKKYISQALFDARQNAYDAAAARLKQAQAQAAVAANQAGYTALRADADGVITDVNIEAGQVVAAGQPVVTLAHDGDMEVAIDVPESRIAVFQPQQPVVVEIWAQDNARVAGTIRELAPEADATSRTYAVRVTLDDASKVQLGMTARVFLNAGDAPQALLLPLAALHEKDGAPAVWVLDARTRAVKLAPVKIGAYREDGVTIVEGLGPQQWVVAAGVHKLSEGQVVKPVDAANKPVKL